MTDNDIGPIPPNVISGENEAGPVIPEVTPIPVDLGAGQETQEQSNFNWKPSKPQGALSRNPSTPNLQSPLGFRFFVRRSPNVNYYVNKCNVPGVSLGPATHATPNLIIPEPGDHIQFEPLVVTFRVDEGMKNYFEISNWMKAIAGFNPRELIKLAANPEWSGYGILSEIEVIVLNAQKNAIRNIFYHRAWPTQLSTLQFDTTLETVDYVPATCVFYYMDYSTDTNV